MTVTLFSPFMMLQAFSVKEMNRFLQYVKVTKLHRM